jgi:hypothetical protein
MRRQYNKRLQARAGSVRSYLVPASASSSPTGFTSLNTSAPLGAAQRVLASLPRFQNLSVQKAMLKPHLALPPCFTEVIFSAIVIPAHGWPVLVNVATIGTEIYAMAVRLLFQHPRILAC